jgi:glutamate-5-semialdehyde dehydrogenase
MRRGMIQGLEEWRNTLSLRDRVLETIEHPGWKVEQVMSGLGVVGFVFEGRPNVFADATGVLRSGNTTVMRIGRDALGTAQAIMTHALRPALAAAGLPEGSVELIESPEHAAGWALFSHPKLGLAVARGSGAAVDQLGGIARQAGIPVSLHGTGGAWIVADDAADKEKFRLAVFHSLDRKVCNTLNTVCIPQERAAELVPAGPADHIDADAAARSLGGDGARLVGNFLVVSVVAVHAREPAVRFAVAQVDSVEEERLIADSGPMDE